MITLTATAFNFQYNVQLKVHDDLKAKAIDFTN